jgi:putative restriction endonuclease
VDIADERSFRQRVMNRLATLAAQNGGTVTRAELSDFAIDGTKRRLIDHSRGIWNPRDLHGTLTVVSSPDGPYADRETDDGLLHYDYRAGSAEGDNTKLRRALELELPLILARKIDTGVYVPIFPVYVVADDRERRQFVLALDESVRFLSDPLHLTDDQRRYAQRIARTRLHQPEFRGRVIRAYSVQCAVCTLKHGELLDAAHIIADSEAGGLPVVSNGLSLCKIHHAAYDRNLLGVSPDYHVHIDGELLAEIDGPMLLHGLQEMHGRVLALPARKADQPDRDRLATRFDTFRKAS